MLQQGFNKAAATPTSAQIQLGEMLVREARRQQPDVAEMKSLIARGADLTVMDDGGNTVFMSTLGWGNLDLTRSLLLKTQDFNHQNASGNTALHLAVRTAPADVVAQMIAGGALTDIPNVAGQTPADLAVQRKDAGIAAIFQKIADEKIRAAEEKQRQLLDATAQRIQAANKSVIVGTPFRPLKTMKFKYG